MITRKQQGSVDVAQALAYKETMKKTLYVLLAAAIFGACLPSTGCRRGNQPQKVTVVDNSDQAIIDQTNAERTQRGLNPLAVNVQLSNAAKMHAHNMASYGELSHELNIKGQGSLTDRLNVAGYQYRAAGENIAWNYQSQSVVEGWMNSSGHRRNILNKNFTEIGVGVAITDSGEPYYCQVFGSR